MLAGSFSTTVSAAERPIARSIYDAGEAHLYMHEIRIRISFGLVVGKRLDQDRQWSAMASSLGHDRHLAAGGAYLLHHSMAKHPHYDFAILEC